MIVIALVTLSGAAEILLGRAWGKDAGRWITRKEKGLGLAPKPLTLMVGARGFEPPTPTTPLWCATRLRYAPTSGG